MHACDAGVRLGLLMHACDAGVRHIHRTHSDDSDNTTGISQLYDSDNQYMSSNVTSTNSQQVQIHNNLRATVGAIPWCGSMREHLGALALGAPTGQHPYTSSARVGQEAPLEVLFTRITATLAMSLARARRVTDGK